MKKSNDIGVLISLFAVLGILLSGATVTINPVMPGSIVMTLTTCPSGYTEVVALNGVTLRGTLAANGNVGGTGGSDLLTATGTISTPTFTGNSVASNSVSAGTPTGTNSIPVFTGDALATHSHTGGTLTAAAQVFTGGSSTVSAQTVSWPAGVPTAANESAHTHSGTTLTAAAQTFTGSALAGHAHELPFQLVSKTSARHIPASVFGTGTSRAGEGAYVPSSSTTSAAVALSQSVTAGTPAGTNASSAVSGNTGAGSAHTHTLSWPAGVPTNSTSSVTPLGTNGTSTVSGSTQAITAGTPSGTNSAPTFTGDALGTHSHTTTATGSISVPTFTGDSIANVQSFVRVIFCVKT